ncbi:MFS transporter [Nonomuraea phyllanthi]|uniref:MFS transporter n=1 Tax=Nonomuraea phyllanthi TaxID=2219224 RepID=A0A5C4W4A0_9ACTN|nr:MFS transporter [Nonomuraea phyllanthi]
MWCERSGVPCQYTYRQGLPLCLRAAFTGVVLDQSVPGSRLLPTLLLLLTVFGPLYAGVAAYVATSLLCALSPGIETLVAARLVQGLAAVIGPLLGGQLARATDWRGLFAFLAAIDAAILALIAFGYRETLPPHRRTTGGFAQTGRDFRRLLSDRVFAGAVLLQGFVNAALFAYLAGATYVLQGSYGLTPQQYALAFGLNSAGFMVFGYLAGHGSERWSVTGTLAAGLAMCALGALGLLAAALLALPPAVVIVSLLVMVSGVAATTPPATTLALAGYPHMAGTASSLLGMARFAFGGLAAPFVGLAGAASMLPLGIVTVVSVALAVAACAVLAPRRRARTARAHPLDAPEFAGAPTR